MSTMHTTGPWRAASHRGYSSNYWVLERQNSAWMGGWQKLHGKGGEMRKWRSEAAAQKAANAENAKATNALLAGLSDGEPEQWAWRDLPAKPASEGGA